jgi:hypothetical protein
MDIMEPLIKKNDSPNDVLLNDDINENDKNLDLLLSQSENLTNELIGHSNGMIKTTNSQNNEINNISTIKKELPTSETLYFFNTNTTNETILSNTSITLTSKNSSETTEGPKCECPKVETKDYEIGTIVGASTALIMLENYYFSIYMSQSNLDSAGRFQIGRPI